MKRLGIGVCVFVTLACALALSRSQGPAPTTGELAIQVDERNPWTHLRLNNEPKTFRFAVVSDRTGGHRSRIFSQAVEQLNLLQPEFVVSVGDLIEGYTDKTERVKEEWREFQGYVSKLEMPFFYVAGNHDISNPAMEKLWQEKFGRRYYHFVYRGTLFLALDSEDPPGQNSGGFSAEQRAWLKEVLDKNAEVRHTLVFLHKPVWTYKDVDKTGWLEMEKLLEGRPYTVFAGHHHRFKKFVRNGRSYYQLATTGGVSKMRGVEYGEVDHVTWVTMKDEGPVVSHVALDGIYTEDFKIPLTDEQGVSTANRERTHEVRGIVLLDGCALPSAHVVFHQVDPKTGKTRVRSDALTGPDGTFALSTYTAQDGAPVGEYVVTVVSKHSFLAETQRPPVLTAPARVGSTETSPLRASVKAGGGHFTFELKP